MNVEVPTWVPVMCLAVGTLLMLRSVIIVAAKSAGRFRGDPLVSLVVGFALILFGQYLLAR